MKNKQPFYHRLTVLFTAIQDISESQKIATNILNTIESIKGVLPGTFCIEEFYAEPGDPANL